MRIKYLYLLAGAGKHAGFFKIGVSIDPYKRGMALSQEVDLDRSLRIGYRPEVAEQNEKRMHSYFSEYRADPAAIGDVSGKTEWFRIECFNEAAELLRQMEQFREFRSMTGILPIEKALYPVNIELPLEIILALEKRVSEEKQTRGKVTGNALIIEALETELRDYL